MDIETRFIFVEVSPVANTKSPVVDSEGNNIALDETVGQRGTCVRTMVVEGKELAIDVEDPDHLLFDNEHAGFPLRNLTDFADVMELGHR